jgi:hypothetical protein
MKYRHKYPDPQRLVMSGQRGASQVIETGGAGRASVALSAPLRVIMPVTGNRRAMTLRAPHAVGPTVLPD